MYRQRILEVYAGKKKVLSRPWDFEAMCLVDDGRESGKGVLAMCAGAVFYLFSGTGATGKVLEGLSSQKLLSLCRTVFEWYGQDLALLASFVPVAGAPASGKEEHLRGIYRQMVLGWGILPADLARQQPKDIFYILAPQKKDAQQEKQDTGCGFLYGL